MSPLLPYHLETWEYVIKFENWKVWNLCVFCVHQFFFFFFFFLIVAMLIKLGINGKLLYSISQAAKMNMLYMAVSLKCVIVNPRPFIYTLPHNSDGVLWFHIGCPCVNPSIQLSYIHLSIFLFPDDNLNKYEWIVKYQWILTKLGRCIDTVEVWFGIANGQILSIFNRVVSHHTIFAGYYHFRLLFVISCFFFVLFFITLQPLYNTVHYSMVLDITRFKDGSQKCIDYIEKWP